MKDITKRKSILIIHRDESSKSKPSLVEMSVWLLSLNLSGLIFLRSSAIDGFHSDVIKLLSRNSEV